MDILESLNPQQRKAVTAPPGAVLVLAGPGSGKTRVLTHRIAYLVSHLGASPSEILVVTFTNKAAREMQARVEALLGGVSVARGTSIRGVTLGTFHSVCARLLRQQADRLPFSRDFVIFDESDQAAVIKQVYKELNLDPKQIQPGKVHAAISAAKNELIDPESFVAETYFGEIVRRVHQRYQALLQANDALDFDDLLTWTVWLLREHEDVRQWYRRRFTHLLVDEFQDTNMAQYALLRLLAGHDPDLFAVGDADQSIYRWRGADYRNVMRFQQDYPHAQVILLEQNYRSTQTILDAGMAVIDRLPGRQRKRLFTDRGRGEPIVLHEAYDEADEARYVVDTIAELTLRGECRPGDCAVMYRTNAQSRALEEAFLHAGLPYRLVGAQRFYGRREVKDLIAYLRLIHNPADQVSLLRVLNTPPRGIGARTVEALLQRAERLGLAPAQMLLALARGEEAPAEGLSARAAAALTEFGRLLEGWRRLLEQGDLVDLIDRVLADIGHREYLDDGTEEGFQRWQNVLELRGVAAEYRGEGLATFLEHVALVSDQDTLTEDQDAPILLTLHAAKGLEFPVVFIVGLDDGLLPHERSFDDPEAMAEERRLFYVGITRAMDRLYLVRAFRRRGFSGSALTEPSRFLLDLPPDLLEGRLAGSLTAREAAYRQQTRWEAAPSSPPQAQFRAGMRVYHSDFGEGIVLETRLDRFDEEVTIEFETQGTKRLLASVAPLRVLEE